MNDWQHSAYEAYLRLLARHLLLADWEITLKRVETTSDCYAQVWVMDTENHAVVRLDEDFWPGSAEDRREWLVHELLHCHVDRIERVLNVLAEQMDSYNEVKLAKALMLKEVEVATQRLARVIAPYLPLPPSEGVSDGETRDGRTDGDLQRIVRTQEREFVNGPEREPEFVSPGRKEPEWRGPEPEPDRKQPGRKAKRQRTTARHQRQADEKRRRQRRSEKTVRRR